MTVWMAVGKPPLSLPLAVADTPGELAKIMGVRRTAIIEHICRARVGKIVNEKYVKVEIEEDEDG